MAFKLPNRPSPRPNPPELADFAELRVLIRGRCSATEIQRYLGRIDDNDDNNGIEDDDEKNEIISDAMMSEIGYRLRACPDGYPFQTDSAGSILEQRTDANPEKMLLYKFLLLATRLKMREEKIQAGVDGTLLMEDLGSEILRSYLGGERARSEVFGTARRGGFENKVNELCQSLSEGGSFRNMDSGILNANDDGLDIVGWIPFADDLASKVCVFGQCKTGTSWRNRFSKLDPPGFAKRWLSGAITVDPIRAFFIAESADRAQWYGVCIYGGILFDRCRIVDFSKDLSSELSSRILTWTDAATARLIEWHWC